MYLYTKMKKMKASKWCGSQQHTHYNSVVGWRGCGMQHKDEAHRNLRCYKHTASLIPLQQCVYLEQARSV